MRAASAHFSTSRYYQVLRLSAASRKPPLWNTQGRSWSHLPEPGPELGRTEERARPGGKLTLGLAPFFQNKVSDPLLPGPGWAQKPPASVFIRRISTQIPPPPQQQFRGQLTPGSRLPDPGSRIPAPGPGFAQRQPAPH